MTGSYRVLSIVAKLRIATTGAAGATGVYNYIDLDVPGLSGLVLVAESVTLITLQKGANAPNIEWNMELIGGYDRDNEVAAVRLSTADINTNDIPVRTPPVTTLTAFLPHSRLRIALKNKDGITGVQSAIISVMLLVKLPS